MKCPNCHNKFSFFQRLKTGIQNSDKVKCPNCKTTYKKISSFGSLCIGLSCFTSISVVEIFLKLNTIDKFLLMLVLITIFSIILYPIYILLFDNFTTYEIIHNSSNNDLY